MATCAAAGPKESGTYRSPWRVLARFFEKSRDSWKEKYKGLQERINVSGPWPADTLFVRAHKGEFDGIVAMYHDEGHIAMKLRCGPRCVNITVGLPIIRTSVAHGTAYDIAGKGLADEGSLIAAADVAARLATNRPATDKSLPE